MLEPWEKALFNSVAGGITLATMYYTYGYVQPLLESLPWPAAAAGDGEL